MYSLRRRLTLVLGVGFTALIVGSALYLSDLVGERVTGEFDAALLAKAQAFVALTEQESGKIELDYAPEHMPEFERTERPEYFQFWLDDGLVLLRSKRLEKDLPRGPSLSGSPAIHDAPLPDGRAGRLVQIAFVPRDAHAAGEPADAPDPEVIGANPAQRAVVLVVARGREGLDRLIAGTRTAILGVGGIAILFAALLVWRVLATGFRPIDSIAAQVEGMDAENMGSRVTLPRAPRELSRVVEQLNALLDRLAVSLDRERRFAGNVAHELRTPIAELRTLASVGAKWPDDKASVVRFFGDVEDIARRMEVLVADLLLLARCQAGVEGVLAVATNLREVVASTWSKVAPAAASAGLRFRLELPEDLLVESDPGKLSIVFANLLGNAVSYARPHSEIRCIGARSGSRFRLDVTNAADPLSPGDLRSLAEPFWRGDESRSAAHHAGLGLSLVTALAVLLGLSVRFGQDADGTFRVTLEGDALETGRVAERSPSLA